MTLNGLNPLTMGQTQSPERGSSATLAHDLGQSFSKMLDEVNALQLEADRKIGEFATSPEKDIHGTMIAMQKANISLRMLMQVRSKMINAYHEIMRMQF